MLAPTLASGLGGAGDIQTGQPLPAAKLDEDEQPYTDVVPPNGEPEYLAARNLAIITIVLCVAIFLVALVFSSHFHAYPLQTTLPAGYHHSRQSHPMHHRSFQSPRRRYAAFLSFPAKRYKPNDSIQWVGTEVHTCSPSAASSLRLAMLFYFLNPVRLSVGNQIL